MEIDGKYDKEDFQALLSAMQVLDFTSDEKDTIFKILASGLCETIPEFSWHPEKKLEIPIYLFYCIYSLFYGIYSFCMQHFVALNTD